MKLILDCDAGVDDLVALLLALKRQQEGEAELLMVGTTFGNSTCAAAERNVLCMLDCLNDLMTDNAKSASELEVPVHRGAEDPLCRSSPASSAVWRSRGWPGHGKDGLGGALDQLVREFDFRYTAEERLQMQARASAAAAPPLAARAVADTAAPLLPDAGATAGDGEVEIVLGSAGAALEAREESPCAEAELPRVPFSERAGLKLVEALHAAAEPVTLVCIGPLTNFATALALDPGIVHLLARVVVMGGSAAAKGNCSLAAEFNFHADPEAARAVFEAFEREPAHGARLELVSWDLTNEFGLSWTAVDRMLAGQLSAQVAALGCTWAGAADVDESAEPSVCQRLLGAVLARFCSMCAESMQLAEERGTPDLSCVLCDTLAMLIALDPTVVEDSKDLNATVEMGDGLCSGQVVFDWYGKRKARRNVTLVTQVQEGALECAICDMVDFFSK